MTAKLYSLLAIFAISTVLAASGVFSYLVLTEKLDAERAEKIAAVLRGELDDGMATTQPAATQPAPGDDGAYEARARSEQEVAAALQRDHLRHQMLERAKRDVEARQRLLDQTLQRLLEKEEQLQSEQKAWAERQQDMTEEVQDAGFEKELELLRGLPTKQAKEHIIFLWGKHKADAVRLFMQLDTSRGARILREFKTPEESRIRSQLLEQLRLQDLNDGADTSGTTDGDESD